MGVKLIITKDELSYNPSILMARGIHLFTIFSSDQATLIVNIIVILTFLSFITYIIFRIVKKVQPDIIENSFIQAIDISSATQNIIAFSSVVLASTLFDLFADGKYRMIWVVLIISLTTIILHIIYNKIANTSLAQKRHTRLNTHFTLLEKVMSCKGYQLILNAAKLETIEDRSQEIYVFTENLTTDIPGEYIRNSIENSENIGLFSEIVALNIPQGKQYTYFLKNSKENIEHIHEFYHFHFMDKKNIDFRKNISFYLVESVDFTFFTEVYLYKDKQLHDMAFEWLPALGEVNNPDKQFYLELSSSQVQDLNEIIIEIRTTAVLYTYQTYLKDSK